LAYGYLWYKITELSIFPKYLRPTHNHNLNITGVECDNSFKVKVQCNIDKNNE